MALSPREVHDRQFKLVRQTTGYDLDEVDAFLEEVETEIARLTAELDATRRSAVAVAGPSTGGPEPSSEAGTEAGSEAGAEAAARILELAQRTADGYLADARRSAEAMVAAAQQQVAATLAGLETQVAELEGRVAALRTVESQVRTHLTEYLRAQLRDLHSAVGDPTGEPGA